MIFFFLAELSQFSAKFSHFLQNLKLVEFQNNFETVPDKIIKSKRLQINHF